MTKCSRKDCERLVKKKGYCSECKKAYNKDWYQKHKPEQLERVKDNNKLYKEEVNALVRELKSIPCMDCGKPYPWFVMDFDHRDPSQKVMAVSSMVRRKFSLEKVKSEISKCDVVCANCHRLRTFSYVSLDKALYLSLDRGSVS